MNEHASSSTPAAGGDQITQHAQTPNASVDADREFQIDTGDSNTGPVGFVAYIKAADEAAALDKLREAVNPNGYRVEKADGVEVIVYLNPHNVKISEVVEEIDAEEPDVVGEAAPAAV